MIVNRTQEKVVSKGEKICRGMFSQARGLMFCRKQNILMVFEQEKTIALHMFFVFFPIDVLILDERRKVVEIKRDFPPFTFWRANEKGKYVVELGYTGEYKIGDELDFDLA